MRYFFENLVVVLIAFNIICNTVYGAIDQIVEALLIFDKDTFLTKLLAMGVLS
jgi:hypothetical protein